ncbi:hypothetical protein Ahy_B01g053267 [Arachis hypogaea]|uniref:Ubiquitin-like protease family profile domain-containing protein n=1 Tax=Arachis hypogaea TaxID=3818 RepID=A0A445ARD8_ARAHY|nr:hypothetical protein Ahy_B01g053267 [Arachis hypogaea]
MTHVKETKDSTDEYDPLFILNHKANFEGLRHHFMSLMPGEQVESTVVNTHCMILNDMKCPQFEKDIYCVPTDIVESQIFYSLLIQCMFMLGNHGENYIDPKTKKAYRFDVDRYTHQRQVLDKRKLASHLFLFVLICNGGHWWLWIADVRKKAFYVLDPVNKKKKEIPDLRIKLNKFILKPLMEDGVRKEAEYIRLNGQCTSYDCGIYVMKWLETIDPRKIKSGKRYQYKIRTQKEIDAFRLEYGPNIIFHKLNKMKVQIIRACKAIRLPKLSAALSSHFCKFTSGDIYSSK